MEASHQGKDRLFEHIYNFKASVIRVNAHQLEKDFQRATTHCSRLDLYCKIQKDSKLRFPIISNIPKLNNSQAKLYAVLKLELNTNRLCMYPHA